MNENFTKNATDALLVLGQQIRAKRKLLHVNATAVAEAAGISRVTLHRIERGEPTVSMGAYMNVLVALGMRFVGDVQGQLDPEAFIPARIQVEKYPQLKKLAWQLRAGAVLTPIEALGIYDRNARHIDIEALEPLEQGLIKALRVGLGGGAINV